ncbi:MAG TPA: response regulator [Candidatus Dormibacteraeota bacterium]
MRFLFRLIFESAGYEVTEAQHGVAALIRIKNALPDLVVTDMMMPVMDGGELITQSEKRPRDRGSPNPGGDRQPCRQRRCSGRRRCSRQAVP